MTESELQSAILDALERLGVWAMRINSGTVRMGGRFLHLAPEGTPDILLVSPYAWLEVKLPTSELSPAQRAWHKRAERAGVRVAVVRSVGEAVAVAIRWRRENAA